MTMSGRLFQPLFSPTLYLMVLFATRVPGASAGESQSQAFRVEIEIRDAEGGEIARHLVIFKEQIVYDFALSEPHDVTVIDGERVTLISRREQIKASVPNDVLVEATARAKADAETRGQAESLGLAAEPVRAGANYSIAFDHRGGRYGYEVSTMKPLHIEQASRFAEFSDWMCRINKFAGWDRCHHSRG